MNLDTLVKLAQLLQSALVASGVVLLSVMIFRYKTVIADSLKTTIGEKDATIERLREELAALRSVADDMLTAKERVLEGLDLVINEKLLKLDAAISAEGERAADDTVSRAELRDILADLRVELKQAHSSAELQLQRFFPSPYLSEEQEENDE